MFATDGTKVITKGQFGMYFFVLLKGSVGVVTHNPKNNEAKK